MEREQPAARGLNCSGRNSWFFSPVGESELTGGEKTHRDYEEFTNNKRVKNCVALASRFLLRFLEGGRLRAGIMEWLSPSCLPIVVLLMHCESF